MTQYKTYHKNPRNISKRQFSDLEKWLDEFGDLSGIVHNKPTDEIIGGNQRKTVLKIEECKLKIVEQYETADRQGTLAIGYVIWNGAKYNYRLVDWDERKAEQANIIANKAGGVWDFDILANQFNEEDLKDWGFTDADFGKFGDDESTPSSSDDDESGPQNTLTLEFDNDTFILVKHALLTYGKTYEDAICKLLNIETAF